MQSKGTNRIMKYIEYSVLNLLNEEKFLELEKLFNRFLNLKWIVLCLIMENRF